MSASLEKPYSGWSDWRRLNLGAAIESAVLAEMVDGGQAFRWQRQPDDTWVGMFDRFAVRLGHEMTDDTVVWSAPVGLASDGAAALARYFDTARDVRKLVDTLPWRSDAHLARCLAAFPGLRILRQPFGETLLGFLCSATKQIVQIKQMMKLIAVRHGAPVSNQVEAVSDRRSAISGKAEAGEGARTAVEAGAKVQLFRLPTWAEIAAVPEAELRGCLLGFRARYIHQTAQFLVAHPGWLEETEAAPYPAAKERLCSLPGVGEKVADCVLLFGAGRLEAFPVDVWILKAMADRYGLHGWKPAQVAHFGRAHFGPLAGLAQQYLFAYERKAKKGKLEG